MTQPHDPTLDEPHPETRRLVWLPLLLLGLAWGVLVPVMTAQAVLATATFFGETATAADHVEQHRSLGLALAVSALLVAAGFALALWGRSAGGGWVFTLLILPTLVLGLLWLGTSPPQAPQAPPSRSSGACQEHSGGDTRCPGG